MNILENLKKVLKSKSWLLWIIIGIIFISVPSFYFINKDLIIWNLWYNFFLFEIVSTIIIAILFWLFIWATIYKLEYFSVKKSGLWFFAWFIWTLVSGCVSCSITLASSLWLVWIISIFPYQWIELKVISIIILLFVNFSVLKNLEVCSIKNKV